MKKALFALLPLFLLFGCASNDELIQTQRTVAYLSAELQNQREELSKRISQVEKLIKEQEEKSIREKKERERVSQQIVNLFAQTDSLNEKIKSLLGKIDELEHQLNMYWRETKTEIANIKKTIAPKITQEKIVEKSYEEMYREALEAYQRANYEDAITKFTEFIKHHSDKPLAPNAYYWLGESFKAQKNYEKAILSFQEIIEKYRTSEFVPKAYLSQAEAFFFLGDKKSAVTTLKRIIELFPKSEEAKIAERRLKNLLSE